jgi:hypothetical protein
VTFPNPPLSREEEALRGEVYWKEFKNTAIEDFEWAADKHIGGGHFFPRPSQLHEILHAVYEDRYLAKAGGFPQLPYLEPTEEGKDAAHVMLRHIYERIEQKSEEARAEKKAEEKKRREFLRRQAEGMGIS